eukprot:GHUV01025870.1.p1 GENE.GHUV01025870.1~~GHUV01025870.1.p1  ORF type:complete len:325 (+),score=98.78 GHUV01025870.1:491-1465(+)
MPVDNFVKPEQAEHHFAASSTGQASLMNGTWLAADQHAAALQHQQALLQAAYPPGGEAAGLIPHHQQESAGTGAAVQHPADLLGHPDDMMGAAPGLPQMQAVHPGVPLMDTHPDMLAEAAGAELMGHLHGEHMHQDVLMPQACMPSHTGNASNGQLLQQQQEQAAWPMQPAQSHSVSSSVGADSNAREAQQQVQSGLRSSGANTGSNAGNRKGWVALGEVASLCVWWLVTQQLFSNSRSPAAVLAACVDELLLWGPAIVQDRQFVAVERHRKASATCMSQHWGSTSAQTLNHSFSNRPASIFYGGDSLSHLPLQCSKASPARPF